MDPFELSDSLGIASGRLAALIDEAMSYDRDRLADVLERVLQEMATGVEELRVAEEELAVQSDQLAASLHTIDVERERYVRLFEFAPDGYVETDELGKILEANQSAATLFGVSTRLLVGKLLLEFVDEKDRRRFRTTLAEAAKGNVPGELRLTMLPRDGETFAAGVRVAIEPGDAPSQLKLWWLVRDISERLRLEEERRALQEDVVVMMAMTDLSRLAKGEDTLGPLLEGVVEIARSIIGGSVSITLVDRRGLLTTASASDELAEQLSEHQHRAGGPCVAAATEGLPFEADVTTFPAAWESLAALLGEHRLAHVLAVPLLTRGEPSGAVNVYLREAPTDRDRRGIDLLAAQASAGIANTRVYEGAAELADQLSTALESRAVIEQAKGVLMALQHCDEDAAFDILRRASQRSNRKLREVATELIAGTRTRRRLPSPPPPRST